jgi:predicted NBD/HSP70 family sugar kinase
VVNAKPLQKPTTRSGTNIEHAHLLNQRVVFETIRLLGPISRAEIARKTSLTNQTVSNIVEQLRADGLLEAKGRLTTLRGQPPLLFDIKSDAVCSIGVHLDRDHLGVVLAQLRGRVLKQFCREWYLPTPKEALNIALEFIRQLQKHAHENATQICGVGVALPGPIDFTSGQVIHAPNFPGWEAVDVQHFLMGATGLPVFVDNDATAAAVGESWYGIGRSLESFFYLFFGIGLGGGIILRGQPHRGFSGNAGEVGHLAVASGRNAKNCGCGNTGCLERYVSMAALYDWLDEGGTKRFDSLTLIELFEARNRRLMRWLDDASRYLVDALVRIEMLLDPEAFVLGGRLPSPLVEYLIGQCQKSLPARQMQGRLHTPRLLKASVTDDAAALGAAALPTHGTFEERT